jgi:glyoxylase-like metal-dependent hydrolase (beta-lactamase superfamily II)
MNLSTLPEPPHCGDYAGLPGDILWIRLPIPGGLRHINVWLLPGPQGWTLVDTGMETAEVRRAWLALEERLPLGRELRGIVVTHHHPDHFGMARWLADRYGVPVHMTRQARAAAGASLASAPPELPSRSEDFAARHGLELDEDMRQILRGGIYRAIVSGDVEAAWLDAGATCPDAGNWTVSVHAGHAPGHVCLHDSEAGILVSGDQLLPSISSNISLYPSNEHEDPLAQYLASLQALGELPRDTLVLPSHGRPFTGLHARARAVREGHEARLSALHRTLVRPAGTMQAAAGLFRLDRLDALNRLLALTETLAHLRWLECRSLVTRQGTGGSLRWAVTDAAPSGFAAQED